MNSTLADLSDTGPALNCLRQDHLAAATLAVPPTLRRARGRYDLPLTCRRLHRECRIRRASSDHARQQKPIVSAIPKTLINYSKILSPFVKQRTYPRRTAPELSTNGHPP